ncbi:hypothetical protein H6P81_000024 [Aristolochia fimbriata]|uniref:Uncharacterized protein n=1 Tax=Aristolochia fimbriata TaxID=158543 RepID=A0AAV7F5W3_ARIFI|nr:hypothetical protein H6P81_000024 [Aristolochia fimbriata]
MAVRGGGPPWLLSSREFSLPERKNVKFFFLSAGTRPGGGSSHKKNAWCDDLLHGRGLWFKSRMAQLRQGKESKKHLTPSCMLHLARGDIAQLVELRSCNWVVAITGWMSNCPGVGVGGSPRVPSSGIPGEEDQVGPCEQLDALSPFNPLSEMWQRKENPWTDPIVSTP